MPYTITIEKTETVTKKAGGDWKCVAEEPITEAPALEGMFRNTIFDGSTSGIHEPPPQLRNITVGDIEIKLGVKQVMGYTPEIDKVVDVKAEIFKQTVETLDLPAVIKAINNLT